jgi:predicted dehydrogenase
MSGTIGSRCLPGGGVEEGFLGTRFSNEQEENAHQGLPVSVIVIGAGERGKVYADYALTNPDKMRVVGVAEPRLRQRTSMAEAHGIPDENVFEDWADVFKRERFADAVIIATPDRLHAAPTISAAEKGYHILLEKPMAPTEEECRAIVKTVMDRGIIFSVCHVLRHTNYTRTLKRIIDSGALGEIVSIQHLEPVGHWHQAHSFVRGNWRRSDESSSMLLAKSCHDVDWIRYIMGVPCRAVSSFGSLSLFRKEKTPYGAAERCVDCPSDVERSCPYSAKKIYTRFLEEGVKGWPVDAVTLDADAENLEKALREGPYGRCVYACDNDAVDNQVMIMEFEGGKTACFVMTAFTEATSRRTRIFGTKSEVEVDGRFIRVFDFLEMRQKVIDTARDEGDLAGHEGGDVGVLENFVEAVRQGAPSKILTGAAETLETHLIVFAAERSRLEKRIVNVLP